MMDELKYTRKQLLKSLLDRSSKLARPPVSNFHVGAAGITPAGDVYVGVNLEFLRMPLNNCVHAEQFLIANLHHHREPELETIAVNAAPCGHCRQFFSELECADTVEFVFGNEPNDSYKLHELLPMRFKPQDLLGQNPPPLLLAPQKLPLEYSQSATRALEQRADEAVFQSAAKLALQEARESFAPYSKCPAGVALIAGSGDVYGGAYLESAAYNPSMQV